MCVVFFFQAEDGIRDYKVTGVQTCALPISANEVQLEAGRAIPMAFFAWDGSSGEHGSRMAVSTWYFLALDRPTPPGVFISPVLAMLVTLTLGFVVVRRAQRRGAFRGIYDDKNATTRR